MVRIRYGGRYEKILSCLFHPRKLFAWDSFEENLLDNLLKNHVLPQAEEYHRMEEQENQLLQDYLNNLMRLASFQALMPNLGLYQSRIVSRSEQKGLSR